MKLLEQLIRINGVSGNESEVKKLLQKAIRPYVNKLTTDNMGNLICLKKGTAPRVMLAAHMDEIGLITKNIRPSGHLQIAQLGGVVVESLIGQRVLIRGTKKEIPGIITTKKMANDDPVKEENPFSLDDLFVDTGLTRKELEKTGVTVGSTIALLQDSGYLADQRMLFGKALDDRIGCYALVEVARHVQKLKNEVLFVFTVQEEVGLYGAKTAAFSIAPDWGIAVDVTSADDIQNENATRIIGNGPILTIKDAEMIANRELNDIILGVAKKHHIPVQREVTDSGTTDALSISLSREGVPSTVMGVAARNIHTTVGVASVADIRNLVKLLAKTLAAIAQQKYSQKGKIR